MPGISRFASVALAVFSILTIAIVAVPSPWITAHSKPSSSSDASSRAEGNFITDTSNGSSRSDAVPDIIAWELFLRTVGAGNARQLVERAGFRGWEEEKSVDRILLHAAQLVRTLVSMDKLAGSLKDKKNNHIGFRPALDAELSAQLNDLDSRRERELRLAIEGFIPRAITAAAFTKLERFVKTEVQRNIRVVKPRQQQEAKKRNRRSAVARSAANNAHAAQSSGGNIYLYCQDWDDGLNVWGTGTLAEQYGSGTSYLVTVTLTSPRGRSNTTRNDWSYATTSNTTGLSMGLEDGTFAIQAQFEQQEGYTDEYGSFIGLGSVPVGSVAATALVLPRVTVSDLSPADAGNLYLKSPPEQVFTARVEISNGVPLGTTVDITFNQTACASVANDFCESPLGYTVENGRTRTLTVTQGNRGAGATVSFKLQVNSSSPKQGSATNHARVENSILDVETPDQNKLARFSYTSPAPTPDPGGGGGCGVEWDTTKFTNPSPDPTPVLNCSSPILLDIAGDGFRLTGPDDVVSFDFNSDGIPERVAWTSPQSDEAFLVLDRDGNNRIDSGAELLGNFTPQPVSASPNGFAALAEFDRQSNGGNEDGQIDRRDTVFSSLRLWQDGNHNGAAEPEELFRLLALDVAAIELRYHESKRRDEYGNGFRYRAKILDAKRARVGRWAWDVFFATAP